MGQGKEVAWDIEVVNSAATRGAFRYAVFDFDGTISLIREGWQKIMIPYFTDELASTPKGKTISRDELLRQAQDFVFMLTGKQTIYQCIHLAELIKEMGGTPQEPQGYKDEYHRRLLERIDGRLKELEENPSAAVNHIVPGSFDVLQALKDRGIKMYLASGTDEVYVLKEASLLGVDTYFESIHGAQADYKTFSKKMVIERIIRENNLHGSEVIGFGDGYVEIENIKGVGGFACGVATDEINRQGIDEWKRDRLTRSGADIIIPDFTDTPQLMKYLFKEA